MVKISNYKVKELGNNNTDRLFKSHMSSVTLNRDPFDRIKNNHDINMSLSSILDNKSLIVHHQNIRVLKGKVNELTSALDAVELTLYVEKNSI
jgi:hypothetical protein